MAKGVQAAAGGGVSLTRRTKMPEQHLGEGTVPGAV